MKNSDEMLESLFDRREKYLAQKEIRRRKTVKTLVMTVPLILLILMSAGAWRMGMKKPVYDLPEDESVSTESSDAAEDFTSDTEANTYTDTKNYAFESTVRTETAENPIVKTDEKGSAANTENRKTVNHAGTTQPVSTIGPAETTGPEETTGPVETTGPEETSGPAETTRSDETTRIEDTDESDETTVKDDPPEPDKLFADVDVNNWAYKYIEYVIENGYMSGRSEDLFEPEDYITRVEFVQALYAMAGSPENTGFYTEHKCYIDVEITDPYYDAVLWSHDNNIMISSALNNMEFSPDTTITRADIAVMMMQYVKYLDCDLDTAYEIPVFEDIGLAPDYSRTAIQVLAGAGVITGKSLNRFDPLAGTSRAEAAVMIKALIDNLHEKKNSDLLERYGLTDMRVSVGHNSSGQYIAVSFKSTDGYDGKQLLPWDVMTVYDEGPKYPMSIKANVIGIECYLYDLSLEWERRHAWGDAKYNDPVFKCKIPYLRPVFDADGNVMYYEDGCGPGVAGRLHDGETLRVTVSVRIGSETETFSVYPRVSGY